MSDYLKADFHIHPFNSDAADLLAAFLADIGFDSFENIPADDGTTIMSAYVPSDYFRAEAVNEILRDFPMDLNITWDSSLIPHHDWNEEWEKNYFKPLILGDGRCVVHSTFHKNFPNAEFEVIVDPKMAFGTGNHATTSMMVEYLFSLNLKERKVLDMGTGTGILAILASKLGASNVVGIEIDPSAYENALENISLNHAEVVLLNGDASLLSAVSEVDFFLANINRNIILEDLEAYISTLSNNGQLILSGFYLTNIPLIQAALCNSGFKVEEVRSCEPSSQDSEGGNDHVWASLRAVRIV